MKRINAILCSLVILISFTNCKSDTDKESKETPKTFTLTAELNDLEADYLVFYEKDESQKDGYRRDTLKVENQKFKFTDSIEGYKMYFIHVPEALRTYKYTYGDHEYNASVKAHLSRLWFIGYPGAEITYSGTVEDYMVNAYPSDQNGINDDLATINKKTFPILNKIDSISVKSYTDTSLSEEDKKELYDLRTELYDKVNEIKSGFVKNHPKSIAATYILMDSYNRKEFSLEESKRLFNNLDTTVVAGTKFYDEVKQRFDAVEKTKLGMTAPEFKTENTLDGSEFALSTLRGKYVLMDYWGTWCGPCMGEMPKIKEVSNKYSDKNFVVLGINSGDTFSKWKTAVDKNNFDWMHVQTTKQNDLLVPFNVSSFPTKILLDPNGKIIYSSNSKETQDDLYKMLDGIFSKS